MPLVISNLDDVDDDEVVVETARRHRWTLTPRERAQVKRRVMKLAMNGETEQVQLAAARLIVDMAAHDQDDQHHLEGQKVNLTATISKAPDEEAAELLAEMRRGDLKPRAN